MTQDLNELEKHDDSIAEQRNTDTDPAPRKRAKWGEKNPAQEAAHGAAGPKRRRGAGAGSSAESVETKRLIKRRRRACLKLGIPETASLLYGAQAAADALGVSVRVIRKHVVPADHADHPYYRNAGAPVGLHDPIDLVKALRKKAVRDAKERYPKTKAAAERAVLTRTKNMEERMEAVEVTIVKGKTTAEIRELAMHTHGGNYRGDPGPFVWSNRTARNCIRHCLTNYERLWALCNRGYTGELACTILRMRVDDLIDETYPQFLADDEVG